MAKDTKEVKVKVKKAEEVQEAVEVGGNPNQCPSWQSVIDGLKAVKTKADCDQAVAEADKYLAVALKHSPEHRKTKIANELRNEVFNQFVNAQV